MKRLVRSTKTGIFCTQCDKSIPVNTSRIIDGGMHSHYECLNKLKLKVNIMNLTMKNGNCTIDGKSFSGSNIQINGNKVVVDGVVQNGELVGDINITVDGDVGSIENTNGTVSALNVGSVKTTNGNVTCSDVSGDVKTTNGDIKAKKINGKVTTVNGDVN